jgi:hypothetical protein
MEEATWYVKQRTHMEGSLWELQQRLRVLQDCRQDMQGIWQDDSASEINNRYLRPHEEDSQRVLVSLNKQLVSLQQSDEELESARQHGLKIDCLSEEVEKLLDFARQDISRSHSEYDAFQEQNSSARAELPIILSLISQANSCC